LADRGGAACDPRGDRDPVRQRPDIRSDGGDLMAFPDNDLQVKVYAYLGADPTDDPSNWPAPVDLTSRLLDRDSSLSLGRSPGQRTAAAGQATIWLNNNDGALTLLLAPSPYYPDSDLGVPI